MKKLMVILITGLLYMSCTDSMEVSGDADRNNTEDVSVRLVITIPASTTYARTRGTFATTDHESKISEIQVLVFEEGKYKEAIAQIRQSMSAAYPGLQIPMREKAMNTFLRDEIKWRRD